MYNMEIYHIFRLKYRCFVYALSMIVPSLYHFYPISHILYRIPYIVYPKNFKISKFANFHKISFHNLKTFLNLKFVHKIHVLSKAWLKYMI